MQLVRTSLSALLTLLATPALHAGVLVVDAAGKGDFTMVSAAVAAAADGDTILVHSGDYLESGPVVIDGKPLSIVANPFDWFGPPFGPPVTIRPGLVVRNLAPNEFVILENLALRGAVGTRCPRWRPSPPCTSRPSTSRAHTACRWARVAC
jgi:hypothetical protein